MQHRPQKTTRRNSLMLKSSNVRTPTEAFSLTVILIKQCSSLNKPTLETKNHSELKRLHRVLL